MTQLTQHFSYEELIYSETAARHGIDNTPSEEVIGNLKTLALLLEEIRSALGGKPIHINSGYRCPEVNALLGSKPTSDHCRGLAADFVAPHFGNPHAVVLELLASGLPFKQIIREFSDPEKGGGWTHIAVAGQGEENKRQALIIDKQGTRPFTV